MNADYDNYYESIEDDENLSSDLDSDLSYNEKDEDRKDPNGILSSHKYKGMSKGHWSKEED